MANEIQRATANTLIANIEDGGIVFVFDGQATTEIAFGDLTSANVQAALEALVNIGSGNVTVTDHDAGSGLTGFTITFQGALANLPQVDIVVDTNTLKRDASDITVVAEATAGEADVPSVVDSQINTLGIAPVASVPTNDTTTTAVTPVTGVDEVQLITTLTAGNTGDFTLNGNSTSAVITLTGAGSGDNAEVQSACDDIWGSGNTSVSYAGDGISNDAWQVTFQGSLAGTSIAEMTITSDTTTAGDVAVQTTTQGVDEVTGVHQQDTTTFDLTPVNGNMTYAGQSLGWNTNASTLTIAGGTASGTPASGSIVFTWDSYDTETPVTVATDTLLSTIGVHQIEHCTLIPAPTAGTITYQGQSLDWNVNANTLTLTGGSAVGTPASGLIVFTWDSYAEETPVAVDANTAVVEGDYQVTTVTLDDNPDEGTLIITVNGTPSAAFAYGADATAVNTALVASSIPFTASGDTPNWTLTANAREVSVTVTAAEDTPLRKSVVVAMSEVQAGSELTAPTDFTATASSSTAIGLTWTDNTSDETGFEIQRSLGGTDDWTTITTTAANATSYSATGLTAETEYDFRIRAVNAGGQGAWSSTATATTEAEGEGGDESINPIVLRNDAHGNYFSYSITIGGR